MSPIVDLGVSYEDVKHMDEFPVVPNASYPFVVKKCDQVKTGPNSKTPGRPMFKWHLEITDPDTQRPVILWYNSVLAWIPPGESEIEVNGLGNLVAICKATGLPWTGGIINSDDYMGRGGTVKVSQKTKQTLQDGEYKDDPSGKKVNEVDGFEV